MKKSHIGQIKKLENAFSGKDCLLLSCGPSLKDVNEEQLRTLAQGRVVIAVKQAYLRCSDFCDFQLLNNINNRRFEYSAKRPVVILSQIGAGRPVFGPIDIRTKTVVAGRSVKKKLPLEWDSALAHSVAWAGNYDDFLLSKGTDRPFGPGIVYEQGVYWALHLGVKRIIAIGWDIGLPGDRSHFDQTSSNNKRGIRDRLKLPRPSDLHPRLRRMGQIARKFVGPPIAYIRYRMGLPYNVAKRGAVPGEQELTIQASYDVYKWLESHGVELCILSDKSEADPRIPRVSVSDLL